MKTVDYRTVAAFVALSLCGAVQARDVSAASQKVAFDIDAPSMVQALMQFTEQSGLQLAFPTSGADEIPAPRVVGDYTPKAALERLLVGSGLDYEFANDRTVSVHSSSTSAVPPSASTGDGTRTEERIRLAQSTSSQPNDASASSSSEGETPVGPTRTGKDVPEILVKGSRLLNSDIRRSSDDPQPYVVFSRKEIERTGAANVEQFLQSSLPSMNVVTAPSRNAGSVFGATSDIGLRGLNSDQTLILIDGRRSPSIGYSGNTFQPDVNSIPVSAIERIEVLSTTAAGIYGGGATGGVINIILKRDFTGFETMLTREDTIDGGGAGNRVDLSGGFSFEGGKSSLTVNGSYSDRDELLVGDRDLAQRGRAHVLQVNPSAILDASIPPLGATTNILSAPVFDFGCFCQLPGEPLTFKPEYGGGAVGSRFTSVPLGYAGPSSDNGAALIANSERYNLDFANTAQRSGGSRQSLFNAPTIKSLTATLRRDFTPGVQAFLELSAAKNEGAFILNNISGTFTLPAFSPGNPFNQDVVVTTPVFGADRITEVSLENRRAVAGLIFALSENWNASADFTWGQSKYRSEIPNSLLMSSADIAINDGSIDLFKDGNAFPVDFSQFVLAPEVDGPGKSTLKDAVVRAGGPLPFSLPGGAVALSASIERNREVFDDFRIVTPTPTFIGVENSEQTFFARSRTVDSVRAELQFPIFGERNRIRGVGQLDLQLAGRWDQYDTDSSNSTNPFAPATAESAQSSFNSIDPTIALRWQPLQDIALRASAGTGFTPPSLIQLGPGTSAFLDPVTLGFVGVTDPLRGDEVLGAQGNSVEFLTGGNPNLQPEESRSSSFGFILTPRMAPGLRLSVDRTRIKKTNNIAPLFFGQDSIALESFVPGLIVRAAPSNDGFSVGPIVGYNSRALNFASQKIVAYDLSAEYRAAPGRFGEFVFSTAATRNAVNDLQTTAASPTTDQLGISFFPKLQGNATLAWSRRNWGASWTAKYTSSYFLNTSHVVNPNQGSAKVGSELFHDAQLSYAIDELGGGLSVLSNSELRLGMKNVFNQRPRVDVVNVSGFYSLSGDPRLATYWLSFRKRFGGN